MYCTATMCDHARAFCTLKVWRWTKACSSTPSSSHSLSLFTSPFTVCYLPLPFARHFPSVTFCIIVCLHNLIYESNNLKNTMICHMRIFALFKWHCMQHCWGVPVNDSTERSADNVRPAGQKRQRLTHGTAENTSLASSSHCKCIHITISNPTDHQMPTMTKRDIYLVLCSLRNTDSAKDLQILGFMMNATRDKSIYILSCSFLTLPDQ